MIVLYSEFLITPLKNIYLFYLIFFLNKIYKAMIVTIYDVFIIYYVI